MKLTPTDLNDPYLDFDPRERDENDVVKVTIRSLERGNLVVFLPEGIEFETSNDEPSQVKVESL